MRLIHPGYLNFYINFEEHFWVNYFITKWSEKSKKEITRKESIKRLYTFVQRLKWVLKDFYIVMRHLKKSLLLLLENFWMKNFILVHEIIDQTLSLFLLCSISTLK